MSTNPGKTNHPEVEKSTVELTLADPLGRGISGLRYQIRQGAKIIAKGLTDANGKIASFVSSIEELTVDVERFASTEMKTIKTFVPTHEKFSAKLLSGKVKEVIQAQPTSGPAGSYRRKTYRVEEGDTLGKIAVRERTTVEVLVRLNNIKNPDKIAKGAILKLPTDAERKAGAASTGASRTADQTPTAQTSEQAAVPAPAPKHAPAAVPAPAPKPAPAAIPAPAPKPAPAVAPVPAPKPAPVPAPKSMLESALDRALDIIRIEKIETRGANGSPKTPLELKCDQNSCIKLGMKGKLVEEINIRLMGFGGSVRSKAPLNEFTVDTEAAVKQFQRDYMGSPETGKVCGAVLRAMDEFRAAYPISLAPTKCPCKKCGGYGSQLPGSKSVEIKKDGKYIDEPEYPGMHRALLWIFRAALFYTSVKDKALGFTFCEISSGYRCWKNNKIKGRTSFNHLGNALDLAFYVTHGKTKILCVGDDLERLRKKIFMDRIGAQMSWNLPNIPSLETKLQGAKKWVHIDVRSYGPAFKQERHYVVTREDVDGQPIIELARTTGLLKLINCGGMAPRKSLESSDRKPIDSLELSEEGLEFIKGFEKYKEMPYDDSEGKCTVGFGHLIAHKKCEVLAKDPESSYHKFSKGVSKDEAKKILSGDVKNAVSAVRKLIHVPLHQKEFDALVSLAFNTGGFANFPKLVSKANMGDYSGCCSEFEDITNVGVEGLVKRRQAEMKMFRNGIYDSKH